MLVGRFNPSLCCVTIIKDNTLYVMRDGRPNLPHSGQALEIKEQEKVD